MKKLIVLFFPILLCSNFSKAQEIFLHFGVGYSAKLNNEKKNDNGNIKGLGTGFDFGAAFGYRFNKYVGVQLGLGFFYGKSEQRNFVDSRTEALKIAPALVISWGNGKAKPYGTVGPVFAKPTIFERINLEDGAIDNKAMGKLSYGIAGTIGCNVLVGKSISIFGEATANYLRFEPDEVVITVIDVNQVVVGVDNYNWDEVPDEAKTYTSFLLSNIGLQAGVRWNFARKDKKEE